LTDFRAAGPIGLFSIIIPNTGLLFQAKMYSLSG
jgi:hypothetical protein